MGGDLGLSLRQARRLAVRSQYLSGPEPATGIDGMRQVLRGLRVLQIDPVNVVARSHLLVLWSRLGGFDRGDLDMLLWRERWLFEYWAHAASIVLTEDYPIHRAMMRAYASTAASQNRAWLAANEEFRRYVLDRLRDSGPLPGNAIEDRAAGGSGGAGRGVRAARPGHRPGPRRRTALHHRPVSGPGPGTRGLGPAGSGRGRQRAVVGAPGGPAAARRGVAAADRAALAVRQPDLRPGPDRTAVGFRLPQRDVRPEAQAAVRLLRDAGAVGGAADRPGGPPDGPPAGRTGRRGRVRRAGVRRCCVRRC